MYIYILDPDRQKSGKGRSGGWVGGGKGCPLFYSGARYPSRLPASPAYTIHSQPLISWRLDWLSFLPRVSLLYGSCIYMYIYTYIHYRQSVWYNVYVYSAAPPVAGLDQWQSTSIVLPGDPTIYVRLYNII